MAHASAEVHPLTALGVAMAVAAPFDPSFILPVVGPALTILGLVLDWWLRRSARREYHERVEQLMAMEARLKTLHGHGREPD
jgi:hypothetical protein